MKKIIVLVLLVMLAGIPFAAAASANSNTGTIIHINPGLLPDSPFYPLKLFLERLQQTFTFSDEAKAEKLFTAAERRLAELNALPEEEQARYAEKLVNAFLTTAEKAEAHQEKIRQKTKQRNEAAESDESGENREELTIRNRAVYALERNLQKAEEAGRPSRHALAKALEKKIRLNERQAERKQREAEEEDDDEDEDGEEDDEREEVNKIPFGLQKKVDSAIKPVPPGQAKKPEAPATEEEDDVEEDESDDNDEDDDEDDNDDGKNKPVRQPQSARPKTPKTKN